MPLLLAAGASPLLPDRGFLYLPLHVAAQQGDPAVVRLLLEAASQAANMTPGAPRLGQLTPLHVAAMHGQVEAARLILKTAPHAALQKRLGCLPIHLAATAEDPVRSAALVWMLLAPAPEGAAAMDVKAKTPLHHAALYGNTAAARLLVRAAPAAAPAAMKIALARAVEAATAPPPPPPIPAPDPAGGPPAAAAAALLMMQRAPPLKPPHAYLAAAACMVPFVPPNASLPLLMRIVGLALPLFPFVAAHWPLTAAQWQQVPTPCPGLARALPIVLRRSEAEAALLVARLPAADSARLQAFALALHSTQRRLAIHLPGELVGRILSHFSS